MRVEVEITPGRANRGRVNGTVLARVREVLGVVRAVVFAPEDLAIVRGDPAERRRFLDDLIVQRSPRMAGVRADYERVLKQRGALLKTAGAAPSRPRRCRSAHARRLGCPPRRARRRTARGPAGCGCGASATCGGRLRPGGARERRAGSCLRQLARRPAATRTTAGATSWKRTLLAELSRMRSQELDRGQNLVGPHRDDLELRLGPLPVRGYASHGECWSTALALRLGCYELLREEFTAGGTPVLILDDVFAELDASRREQLALVATKAEQVMVTAAVGSDVPEQLRGLWFDVQEGMVQRVA